MRVLVFGGSGYIGGHVTHRLLADGCDVTLAVRCAARGAPFAEAGAAVLVDSVQSITANKLPFEQHDAVIWCAQLLLDDEADAVRQMLAHQTALKDKTFIFTSGTSLLSKRTDGDWIEDTYTEDDTFIPRRQIAPRLATENMVRNASGRGIRALCIRPPMVWGPRW